MIGGQRLQTIDYARVVERVIDVVGREGLGGGQGEFDVEQQRLGAVLLPCIDADACFDAQIVYEYGIQGRVVALLCYNAEQSNVADCR